MDDDKHLLSLFYLLLACATQLCVTVYTETVFFNQTWSFMKVMKHICRLLPQV